MNEYVAEYPRPPRIELISGSVAIYIQDEIIARDCEYIRVCETYHPPSIYIKPSAFTEGTLRQTTGQRSFCEWKEKKQHSKVTVKTGLYNQRVFNRLLLMTVDR